MYDFLMGKKLTVKKFVKQTPIIFFESAVLFLYPARKDNLVFLVKIR